ncbi:MAG: hypothetical protein Kow00104_03050 [Rhodothalassiaceae bacterium]
MPELLDFDPNVYFRIAAENLLRNFGLRALYYADEAIKKMRALEDEDGFEMWLAIREQLIMKASGEIRPEGETLH